MERTYNVDDIEHKKLKCVFQSCMFDICNAPNTTTKKLQSERK